MHDGGDPIYFADLSRAIKRMSYDYQMIEEEQKKKHNLTKLFHFFTVTIYSPIFVNYG